MGIKTNYHLFGSTVSLAGGAEVYEFLGTEGQTRINLPEKLHYRFNRNEIEVEIEGSKLYAIAGEFTEVYEEDVKSFKIDLQTPLRAGEHVTVYRRTK